LVGVAECVRCVCELIGGGRVVTVVERGDRPRGEPDATGHVGSGTDRGDGQTGEGDDDEGAGGASTDPGPPPHHGGAAANADDEQHERHGNSDESGESEESLEFGTDQDVERHRADDRPQSALVAAPHPDDESHDESGRTQQGHDRIECDDRTESRSRRRGPPRGRSRGPHDGSDRQRDEEGVDRRRTGRFCAGSGRDDAGDRSDAEGNSLVHAVAADEGNAFGHASDVTTSALALRPPVGSVGACRAVYPP
jgi:hypothetical protein